MVADVRSTYTHTHTHTHTRKRYEADIRTVLKVWTSLCSPPSGAGDGAPSPERTPKTSRPFFLPGESAEFQFNDDIDLISSFGWKLLPKPSNRSRREGKVVGNASVILLGGGALSPEPDGGERKTFVL
ncbi:hypothetical protein ACLB2K_040614 [Fragaria x ananassa]